MATLYSNLYDDVTNEYKGPVAERVGQLVTVLGQWTDVVPDSATTIKLCPGAAGAILVAAHFKAESDEDSDNDFTFDFGTTTTTNVYLNDDTGLQATTVVTLAFTDLIEKAALVAGDDFLITRAAGETTAGPINFMLQYVIPVAPLT